MTTDNNLKRSKFCLSKLTSGFRIKKELGEDYSEFLSELIFVNRMRITWFGLLSVFIFLVLLIFDVMHYRAGKWDVSIGYAILFFSHLSIFIIISASVVLVKGAPDLKSGDPQRFYQHMIHAILWLSMINTVVIATGDVYISGTTAAYIGVAFTFAAIFIISNGFCLFLYLSNMIFMLYTVNMAAEFTGADFGIQKLNIVIFTILSIVLSRVVYYAHVRDFKNRKLIRLQKQQLLELSIRDHLTNTLNRRSFAEICAVEIARSKRHGGPLSLIIFDLDNFKQINDQFGHSAGDTVLIQTARLIQENIRKTDSLFRWGGEEFIILSPETNLDEMALMAEKLRRFVELHPYPDNIRITASFGVAQYFVGESIEETVQRADLALYEAKTKGRNCVEKSSGQIYEC